MKIGWGARRHLQRTATALVALTLLPVAVFVVSTHPGVGPSSTGLPRTALTASDVDLPSVEALQRSEASSLFAPFSWNGAAATGPFVSFALDPSTGTVEGYSAVNRGPTEVLIDRIELVGFSQGSSPQIAGPTLRLNGVGVTLTAHQEPMALLEIETSFAPRSVVFVFPARTSNLELSRASVWPRASLSFTVGDSGGCMILGKGTMTVNGTTVTANLEAGDYLALSAVPSFADHAAVRTAILDAFASGRLTAEYDLVAMTNGNWLENAAQYQPDLTATSEGVKFNAATVTMKSVTPREGLVLLAFDPRTMPADSSRRLVVTNNGVEIAEAQDPLGALYAAPGPARAPSFSRLSMNATVLVVYLPTFTTSSLQVESIAVPSPGPDGATELAIIAAVFVVSLAAAVMFRPPRE